MSPVDDRPRNTPKFITDYAARRITYDSDYGYQKTRARFDEQVPLLDGAVAVELVVSRAPWSAVQAAVNDRVGPTGFVAMARIDQGALLSLSGEALDGTLYLVGNPIVASDLIAPLRVDMSVCPCGKHRTCRGRDPRRHS